jgi:hypothetical protein
MRLNIEHRTELIKGIKGQRIEGAFEDGVERAYYRCYDPALAHESIQVVPTVTMPGSTTRTSSGTTPMATITTHAHTSMTKPNTSYVWDLSYICEQKPDWCATSTTSSGTRSTTTIQADTTVSMPTLTGTA